MKKTIITLISIIVIIICGAAIYFLINNIKTDEDKNNMETSKYTEGVKTVLSLDDEISDDSIWCGTFQLIWNDLEENLAKREIVFTPQLTTVENLNKKTFTTDNISDKYYYKKIGIISEGLRQEIENDIKNKFNEKSDILDEFDWKKRNNESYFLYSMLKKEFEFEKEFQQLEKGKFGEYENVKYFGIKNTNKSEALRKQVKVLYYNSNEDFAIELSTKGEDKVVLCKNPKGNNFNEIYQNITNLSNQYNGDKVFEEGETLKIPNIEINTKDEFYELENKPFLFSNGDTYMIEKAMQTINFELNKSGGKIKSEAGMAVSKSSLVVNKLRDFSLDSTFAIFLIENDKKVPYFAGKIDDITKFQNDVK